MKYLLFFLISFFLISHTKGQDILGYLTQVNRCQFTEQGQEIIKTKAYRSTLVRLSNEKFIVNGENIKLKYELFDKQVDSSTGNNLVIHYLSESYGKLNMVAYKMCNEDIIVAVFPMDGSEKFTEYIIKPRKQRKK